MDVGSFEKFLEGKSREIRAKAIMLFNGTAKCAEAYQAEPNSSNRRNWEDSATALDKFISEYGDDSTDAQDEDKPLQSLSAVLEYLQTRDWRVTKTSLYRHHKEGKIAPRRDGFYALRDVDKYARTWLKEKSTGKKVAARLEEMQVRKLANELDLQEEEKKRRKRENERSEGLLIPKKFMNIELAGRAGALDAGLKHWVKSRAAEWIRTSGGDTKKVGELINLMTRELDEHLNIYSAPIEYSAEIDAPEEMDEASEISEEVAGEGITLC